MKTLFKKDSKNKIRVINFWCEGEKFYTSAGLLDGQLVENYRECKPKNIGKSNKTTGKEQAILEMESKIREKLQEDYFTSLEEAKNSEVILPMLAKSYENEEKKIDWNNCYIQPKLDGMRCLAIIKNGKVRLLSRDGVDIQEQHKSMNHIIESLSNFKEDVILDGELYAHGLSFQENMKLIKKYRENQTEQIKYHIYDLVSEEPFTDRSSKLSTILNFQHLINVNTLKIEKHNIFEKHSENISFGYEGSIVRWGKEGYKMNARSSNLLKLKDFKDLDAKIIDIIPAENRPDWGIVVCEYNGKTFKATPKMSQEDKIELLKNKKEYVNKLAIITYFEFSDEGLPRFPIYKGVRLDNF